MNTMVTDKRGGPLTASLLFASVLLMAAATSSGQDAEDEFNLDSNGLVYALMVQPDGKILVGGTFGTIGGGVQSYIARLLSSGRLDTSFNTGIIFGHEVSALALQPDGRIIIGGIFTKIVDSVSWGK